MDASLIVLKYKKMIMLTHICTVCASFLTLLYASLANDRVKLWMSVQR